MDRNVYCVSLITAAQFLPSATHFILNFFLVFWMDSKQTNKQKSAFLSYTKHLKCSSTHAHTPHLPAWHTHSCTDSSGCNASCLPTHREHFLSEMLRDFSARIKHSHNDEEQFRVQNLTQGHFDMPPEPVIKPPTSRLAADPLCCPCHSRLYNFAPMLFKLWLS